ncbi:TonB-dependent receptor plug domain-containing protein [Carboxylicivirga caseinilyticus]|uniref:TonB-dependent receptor plug domain-containing protein n=1 Tax=Carboxylicivirga caseinilyticus TaxID=3417572 RepID=UPI003D356306|nr:TonB-dependent receptor [Marinilabiliaceae bacterium A049]
MIRISLLIAFVCTIFISNAQTISVRDAQNLQPLELVTIFTSTPTISTVTNTNGKASLEEFADVDSIFFRLIGYESKILSYQQLKKLNWVLLLEPSELSLDEIIVSATKWKQGRRETPSKVTILKPKDITFLNPQTAADLIANTGDVYIQKSQLGGGSPMIRGFATNRVLITVDGVRMNNAIFRSGNLQNIISLDPFSTNRAEVIFGPGSVIYGSDAIGGVMGFLTFDPIIGHGDKTLIKLRANTRYSSANNEATGHFDLNLGFEKWASFTSFTYSDFSDLKMGSNGPDEYLRPEYVITKNGVDQIIKNTNPELQTPTAYNQVNLMQKFKYTPNNNWQLNYSFNYSESSNVDRYDRLIQYKNNTLRYAEWYYGPQVWMMNNLSIQHSSPTKIYDHMHIIASHQHFKESRHNRSLNSSSITHRTEKVNAINLNVDFEKNNQNGNRLFYGFEAIGNSINSEGLQEDIFTNITAPASSRYPDGSVWLSTAAYGNYLHKVTKKTSLQGGVRYNYIHLNAEFSDEFFDFRFDNTTLNTGALTGSLGIIHNPNENIQLSSSLSTGFRAPNIDDIGKVFDSEPGSVVVPNPDLKPEYAINGEVGAAIVVIEKLKIDMAAYYTWLTNAMVRRDYQLNGQDSILYDSELSKVQAIQNAAHAKVYGIQAGMEYKWRSGISASSRFNYQKGQEELDDGTTSPLRHAAPWFGVTHLSYETEKLKLDFNIQYNGEVSYNNMPESEIDKAYMYALDTNGNPYAPGWTTINLVSQYHITPNLLATAGIENITNKRYKTYSSGIAAPGRNIIISLMLSL